MIEQEKNFFLDSFDLNLKPLKSKFYLEQDELGKPLCFFEVSSDTNYEDEYFLTNLPKSIAIKHPCYLVLYTTNKKGDEIESLRVKKVFPIQEPFKVMNPRSFLGMINAIKAFMTRNK